MPGDDVVFTSLILKTRNSSLLWKVRVESWQFRCQQQCLVKLHCAEVAGKLAALLEDKTKYACIVEADESLRIRMEGASQRYLSRRSHCRKRHEFIKSLHSSAQIYSYASSNKNNRCKGRRGKRTDKLEQIPAWQLTKVRNKKEVIAEARNEGRKNILRR